MNRFEVWLVNLDPTVGAEMTKTRPGVIISPDEMNRALRTVLIAPMTSRGITVPSRVACNFGGVRGQVALDQLRAMDKSRLVRRLGKLTDEEAGDVLQVLAEMFAR
ncbi:MAG: type II toxin-antitoxin system PemK/MazF family toxin [Verrucomicrobia bacterium]|nr:type II toxin-antitoxin system PemK/MazF family toxin [Verrucomicrobiota bacterium]